MPRKRKPGRPKGSRNKGGGGGGGSGMMSGLNSYYGQLLRDIALLQGKADALAQAINAMGAVPASRGTERVAASTRGAPGRKRAKKGSLKECIIRVLTRAGGAVPVKDIISGVRKVGYKTSSRSLGNQISMALRVLPQAKKVAHGMYSLAG